MKYLVDANVLSEPTRPSPDQRVIDWLRAHERDLAVDPIILGEIQFGIRRLPNGKRRAILEHWFETVVARIHCVSWDADTGLRWAELLTMLRKSGKAMPVKDSLIATTALINALTVVTRNHTDFKNAGVRIVDPFTR